MAAIREDRQKVYGDPKKNHEGIALMWASILQPWWIEIRNQQPVPPHVVALLMGLLKANRMRLVYHEDNFLDAGNYFTFARDWQKGAPPPASQCPTAFLVTNVDAAKGSVSVQTIADHNKEAVDWTAIAKLRSAQDFLVNARNKCATLKRELAVERLAGFVDAINVTIHAALLDIEGLLSELEPSRTYPHYPPGATTEKKP